MATSLAEPKAKSSARLRAGPMPGISSSGLLTNSFLRRARWVPMAKRCASSRRRWTKNNAGSRGRKLEELAALDEEGFPAGVAVGALGDRDQGHPFDAERGQNLARGLELPAPAVDDDEVGGVGKSAGFGGLALPHEPAKAARQHLAHHRIVVARRQIGALDVEGAVLVLDEALGAGDHHRPDRVRPHDVGIVVNFGAPDRMIDAERRAERGDELLLARGFRELARQRFARVAHRGVDEILLFAAPRRADRDAMASARAQDLAQSLGARNRVAQQHEAGRRPFEVELGEKGVEHLLQAQRPVGAGKIGAVAPVLVGAEEEHLDAELRPRPR